MRPLGHARAYMLLITQQLEGECGGGGFQIWYSKFSLSTQSISVHEAAARAATAILQSHGIAAEWSSRLD